MPANRRVLERSEEGAERHRVPVPAGAKRQPNLERSEEE
jgi:hypothetical protein